MFVPRLQFKKRLSAGQHTILLKNPDTRARVPLVDGRLPFLDQVLRK